jgi:uncharacterized protein YegL
MEKKHQVHNLIILDESGSMSSIKRTIISGFNELVQTIQGTAQSFPEQEHFISFVTFNGLGQKVLHFQDPVAQLNKINGDQYRPDASTPLFDAMGFSLNKLKAAIDGQTDYNVLVTVMTDGEENASTEYDSRAIKALVEELKAQRWTFTYIGTDHDVTAAAQRVGINNTMNFEKSEAGIKDMFYKEQSSRMLYYEKIQRKEDTRDDFFNDIKP